MKRLLLAFCAGFGVLIVFGMTFIAVADAPVQRQAIVKTLPVPQP